MKMLDDLRFKHPGAIIVLPQQGQGKISVVVESTENFLN
jgi:hypothetical protein